MPNSEPGKEGEMELGMVGLGPMGANKVRRLLRNRHRSVVFDTSPKTIEATPVLSAALHRRFSSRGDSDFQDKLLSATRYEFGGHVEKAK
jgi:6-phosphogluconate dehydrogenase (decarboxylating)